MKMSPLKSIALGLSLSSVFFLSSCGGEAIPDEAATTTEKTSDAAIFPISAVLEIVSKENDLARMLYTKAIVGPGKKQGLKFDENWRKDDCNENVTQRFRGGGNRKGDSCREGRVPDSRSTSREVRLEAPPC